MLTLQRGNVDRMVDLGYVAQVAHRVTLDFRIIEYGRGHVPLPVALVGPCDIPAEVFLCQINQSRDWVANFRRVIGPAHRVRVTSHSM